MAQTDAMRRFGWGDAKQASRDPSASDCLTGVDKRSGTGTGVAFPLCRRL